MAVTAQQMAFLQAGLFKAETLASGQIVAVPLNGGKVYTYVDDGGTTDKDTWQDGEKAAPSANPIILDSHGRALAFGDGAYRIRIDDADDNTLYTWDHITYFDPTTLIPSNVPLIGDSGNRKMVGVGFKITGVTDPKQFKVQVSTSFGPLFNSTGVVEQTLDEDSPDGNDYYFCNDDFFSIKNVENGVHGTALPVNARSGVIIWQGSLTTKVISCQCWIAANKIRISFLDTAGAIVDLTAIPDTESLYCYVTYLIAS